MLLRFLPHQSFQGSETEPSGRVPYAFVEAIRILAAEGRDTPHRTELAEPGRAGAVAPHPGGGASSHGSPTLSRLFGGTESKDRLQVPQAFALVRRTGCPCAGRLPWLHERPEPCPRGELRQLCLYQFRSCGPSDKRRIDVRVGTAVVAPAGCPELRNRGASAWRRPAQTGTEGSGPRRSSGSGPADVKERPRDSCGRH